MKLKLLPLAIASVAMLLFSCQSSVSVAKKRYSNGYYVSVSHNEQQTPENKEKVEYKKDISVASKEVKMESATLAEPVLNMELRELNNAPLKNETANISASKTTTASTAKTVPSTKKTESKKLKKENKSFNKSDDGLMTLLLVILCFLFPPIAVGIATDWELTPVLINILLCLLFWVPGVIHALIVVLGR